MQPTLAAALLLCASASAAQMTPDPSAYPELQQATYLPQIVTELRRTLRDPGSVNDVTVCSPIKVKMKDGRASRWTVMLSLNAKNAYGGYVGRTIYGAIFYAGKSPRLTPIVQSGAEGLDGLIARATEKQMAGCPRVPDAEVQRLLNS